MRCRSDKLGVDVNCAVISSTECEPSPRCPGATASPQQPAEEKSRSRSDQQQTISNHRHYIMTLSGHSDSLSHSFSFSLSFSFYLICISSSPNRSRRMAALQSQGLPGVSSHESFSPPPFRMLALEGSVGFSSCESTLKCL